MHDLDPACSYCAVPTHLLKHVDHVVRPGDAATLDHWVPTSRGGPDEEDNYRLSCNDCNLLKGQLLPEVWTAFMLTVWTVRGLSIQDVLLPTHGNLDRNGSMSILVEAAREQLDYMNVGICNGAVTPSQRQFYLRIVDMMEIQSADAGTKIKCLSFWLLDTYHYFCRLSGEAPISSYGEPVGVPLTPSERARFVEHLTQYWKVMAVTNLEALAEPYHAQPHAALIPSPLSAELSTGRYVQRQVHNITMLAEAMNVLGEDHCLGLAEFGAMRA